jgi:hypothetical protein
MRLEDGIWIKKLWGRGDKKDIEVNIERPDEIKYENIYNKKRNSRYSDRKPIKRSGRVHLSGSFVIYRPFILSLPGRCRRPDPHPRH